MRISTRISELFITENLYVFIFTAWFSYMHFLLILSVNIGYNLIIPMSKDILDISNLAFTFESISMTKVSLDNYANTDDTCRSV